MEGDDDDQPPVRVVVPWTRLSPDALRGVIEEFVTREGTEYGVRDVGMEAKVAAVRRQLERGEVVVVFDGESGSVNVVRKEELEVPPEGEAT